MLHGRQISITLDEFEVRVTDQHCEAVGTGGIPLITQRDHQPCRSAPVLLAPFRGELHGKRQKAECEVKDCTILLVSLSSRPLRCIREVGLFYVRHLFVLPSASRLCRATKEGTATERALYSGW